MYPPKEGRDLSDWKIKICELEAEGLSDDVKDLNKLINDNKKTISEADLKKLNFIKETLINRAEVVAKLYKELENESTTH